MENLDPSGGAVAVGTEEEDIRTVGDVSDVVYGEGGRAADGHFEGVVLGAVAIDRERAGDTRIESDRTATGSKT